MVHKANLIANNKAGSSPLLESIRMQRSDIVRFLLHRFGMEALGGPEVWQKCLKLAKKVNNEKIFQLLVRANSTEIIRENIYKNLKIVYQQYESLRDRLGKAEYLCALLDRHGFYGKSQMVEHSVQHLEILLEKLFSNFGNQNPEDCTEELIYESKDYKDAQSKLKELIEVYEEHLNIPHPFPEEAHYLQNMKESPASPSPSSSSTLTNPNSSSKESETNSDTTLSDSTEESTVSKLSHNDNFDSAADDDRDSSAELTPAQLAKKREKKLKRYQRKKSLHDEIEKNVGQLMDKMVQSYPTVLQRKNEETGAAGDHHQMVSAPDDLNVAIENFNAWKAKVTAEVVEAVRRIDTLSRQLHDALTYGYKLMEEQGKEGKMIISQLVHTTLADKEKQLSVAERVENCRSYQNHLKVLLSRAEEREEKLLQIELEERKKRDEQSRIDQEKRLMASPRKHMSDEEALRIAEMEVEKYNRKKEYSPEELKRLELLKEKARTQKEQEDKDAAMAEKQIFETDTRVEFPEESLSVKSLSKPKLEDSVFDVPPTSSVEEKKEEPVEEMEE